MDTERWLPVPGYEGHYEVSNTGRVRSIDRAVYHNRAATGTMLVRGQELSRWFGSTRLQVTLSRNDTGVVIGVGRTVLLAFVGPCPDGMECCHGDGDPWNNNLNNLRWDTRAANQDDSVQHGTHYQASKTRCDNGHEYTPENTRLRKGTGGHRACRQCNKAHHANYRAKILGLEPPKHGTLWAYTGYGCRCDVCKAAKLAKSRRDRQKRAARRLMALSFFGAIAAGAISGTAVARADGVIDNTEAAYVLAYGAGAVCPVIAEYPSKAGVMGVAQGIMNDGFAADSAVDIINASVANYCPRYWPLLEAIGAEARGEGPLRRAI